MDTSHVVRSCALGIRVLVSMRHHHDHDLYTLGCYCIVYLHSQRHHEKKIRARALNNVALKKPSVIMSHTIIDHFVPIICLFIGPIKPAQREKPPERNINSAYPGSSSREILMGRMHTRLQFQWLIRLDWDRNADHWSCGP